MIGPAVFVLVMDNGPNGDWPIYPLNDPPRHALSLPRRVEPLPYFSEMGDIAIHRAEMKPLGSKTGPINGIGLLAPMTDRLNMACGGLGRVNPALVENSLDVRRGTSEFSGYLTKAHVRFMHGNYTVLVDQCWSHGSAPFKVYIKLPEHNASSQNVSRRKQTNLGSIGHRSTASPLVPPRRIGWRVLRATTPADRVGARVGKVGGEREAGRPSASVSLDSIHTHSRSHTHPEEVIC